MGKNARKRAAKQNGTENVSPPSATTPLSPNFPTSPVKTPSSPLKAEPKVMPNVNGTTTTPQPTPSSSSFRTPAAGSSSTAPTQPEPDLGSMNMNGNPEPTSDPEQLKDQGNFYFKDKEYGVAIDLYTQAIQQRQDPTYYANRAAAYIHLKKYREALTDCQTASSLQSEAPQLKTLARLAKCHAALGDAASALTVATQALKLDPGNAAVLQTRSIAEGIQGHLERMKTSREGKDWGQARWALERAIQGVEGEYPIQWRVWKIELDVCKRLWEEAQGSAATALRLEPNSPDVLSARGHVLFLTNQIPACIDHLKGALRLDQEHPQARTLFRRVKEVEKTKEEGNTFFKAGNWEEAVGKYSQTLELIGEADEDGGGGHIRSVLLSNRATTLLKMKDYAAALADTEAAITLMPTSWKAYRTQSKVHTAQELYEEAVRDIKAAQEALEAADGSQSDLKTIAEDVRIAEVALKRSKTKDYYKILCITKEATDIEIKKAYRRQSLEHHPDKGGDEEKFKLVVEAHSVLSDGERRAKYDRGEDVDGSMASDPMMNPFGGGVDLNDIFAAMHGGFPGGGGRGGGRRPPTGAGGGHFHSHSGFSF